MTQNILTKIIDDKHKEIDQEKSILSLEALKQKLQATNNLKQTLSLKKSILSKRDAYAVIAEFKRGSPSKGIFNKELEAEKIVKGYVSAGACGVSILTDEKYFFGSLNDIPQKGIGAPILRKDFIIDEYQIYEAKLHGADVILLIAAVLTKEQIASFTKTAKELGLEVLLEIHEQEEIKKIDSNVDIVGINNRDLKTFKVDLNTTKQLIKLIDSNFIIISESGINSRDEMDDLKKVGVSGFLVGERFMREEDPVEALKEFLISDSHAPVRASDREALKNSHAQGRASPNIKKLKICGLKHLSNIKEINEITKHISTLYGFIFYPKSKRFVDIESYSSQEIEYLKSLNNKVGVFVDQEISEIQRINQKINLEFIQLHGSESPEYCRSLCELGFKIIKAFGIDNNFEFEKLTAYQPYVELFLFDNKDESGSGGTGKSFDWSLLNSYKDNKNYLISGGIDLNKISDLKQTVTDSRFNGVDINSKFEIEPALKDTKKIETLLEVIYETK